jgi:hypothetical protein
MADPEPEERHRILGNAEFLKHVYGPVQARILMIAVVRRSQIDEVIDHYFLYHFD